MINSEKVLSSLMLLGSVLKNAYLSLDKLGRCDPHDIEEHCKWKPNHRRKCIHKGDDLYCTYECLKNCIGTVYSL